MTFFCPECEAPAKRGFRIANMILFRCRSCNFRWTEFLMQPSLEGGDPVPWEGEKS